MMIKLIDRRSLLLSFVGTLATARLASAQTAKSGKKVFQLDPRFMPQVVAFPYDYIVGTVVVDPANRFLYLVEAAGLARRYGIGVGKAGLAFRGTAEVGRKAKWPRWRPTDNMIRRDPKKYAKYADGVPGGRHNPLGARALYLYRNGQDTLYRIHGTTEPWTIGKAVSNGCVRMVNDHVTDLYERVPVGTRVVVIG